MSRTRAAARSYTYNLYHLIAAVNEGARLVHRTVQVLQLRSGE